MEKLSNKVILLILDGWGLSPSWRGNALKMAKTESFDYLYGAYPHLALNVVSDNKDKKYSVDSGISHAIISSGRNLRSNCTYIDDQISSGSFNDNQVLREAMKNCVNNNSSLHLIGLISDKGIYSHIDHLDALLQLAREVKVRDVFIHVISDGIDTPAKSVEIYLDHIRHLTDECGIGTIASICGRRYCFENEATFKQIVETYRAIALSHGKTGIDIYQTVADAYKKNLTDALIPPTIFFDQSHPIGKMKDFDSIIFFNFDDSSLRPLASIFAGTEHAIRRKEVYNMNVTALTDYFFIPDSLGIKVAFKRNDLKPNLAEIISNHHVNQIHLSDCIKNSELTYYFNGQLTSYQLEDDFFLSTPGENLSISDKLARLTNKILSTIQEDKYGFILINLPYADLVAHQSNFKNVINTTKLIDAQLLKIEQKAKQNNYNLLITSDHGFIEQRIQPENETAERIQYHTKNPVPLILIAEGLEKKVFDFGLQNNLLTEILSSKYYLTDLAPTILEIIGIPIPDSMQGHSLLPHLVK